MKIIYVLEKSIIGQQIPKINHSLDCSILDFNTEFKDLSSSEIRQNHDFISVIDWTLTFSSLLIDNIEETGVTMVDKVTTTKETENRHVTHETVT